jgi:hypothetical protein
MLFNVGHLFGFKQRVDVGCVVGFGGTCLHIPAEVSRERIGLHKRMAP